MGEIKIIPIEELKPHEQTIPENLKRLENKIRENGYLINPIIVDQDSLVILDGHHRAKVLKLLGYKKVPAFLVDYSDKGIKVFQRRPEIPITKEIIIKKALAGEVFPCKTSKHQIPKRPMRLNIPLEKLK